ncbi:MAG TPA: hypothetical protein VK147_11910 [Candidatus Didemnitutus sp.]|nr:hypothetical protein [Candidatus Didemnitutus sp.]
MYRCIVYLSCVILGIMPSTLVTSEEIDLGIDFQMNAIAQIERAFDGSIWGLTSTTQETMPTVAGVYAFISTNGVKWDSSCVTPNWWRWGVDIAPISAKEAWVIMQREDTTELYRTVNGGKKWSMITPARVRVKSPHFIHFFSPTTGIIIGQEGRTIERKWIVSRTTDGGATWNTSIPMLAEPATEEPTERNDRSAWVEGGEVYLGMTSGRVMSSQDSGKTWRFIRVPLGGSISSIARIAESKLLMVHTSMSGTMRQATTVDNGATWNTLVLFPVDVPPLHGLRKCADGSIVTIPNEYTKTPLTKITGDLSSARILSAQAGYSVLEQSDKTFLVGAEILPGQGVRIVKRY